MLMLGIQAIVENSGIDPNEMGKDQQIPSWAQLFYDSPSPLARWKSSPANNQGRNSSKTAKMD